MKNNAITHLILLPVVFFLCIPALFVKQNIGDIENLDFKVFIILLVFAFISAVLLLSTNALFGKKLQFLIFGNVIEFVCFFVIATGFLFPASISIGMMDPEIVPVNFRNLLLALMTASAMIWVARSKHRPAFYAGVMLFVALNTAVSGYVIISKFGKGDETPDVLTKQSLYEVSITQNIFVLSFDGISGSAAHEILSENESLSKGFDGLTLFSHAISSSPGTSASTAASLYGNRDFKSHFRTDEELWNSAPDDLLTNVLKANGFQVSTFSLYNKNFSDKSRIHGSSYVRPIDVSELVNYTIARTMTSKFVLTGQLHRWLERGVRNIYIAGNLSGDSFSLKIAQSKAPKWKQNLAATFLDWVNYFERLNISTSEPVAHFLHFTFTHYPVEFDRNCIYRGHEAKWYEDHQNRFGVKEETYCALKLFSDFLTKLRSMGIFDQSMVILKSDHGKPVAYYNPGGIEALKINNHSSWGYGRYVPFLAIKEFDSDFFSLKENTSPVLLDDLAKTICSAALDHQQCEKYPGYNIMDEALFIPPSAAVTVFVVRSEDSTHEYDTHKSVTVKRQPDILQNLYNELSGDTN